MRKLGDDDWKDFLSTTKLNPTTTLSRACSRLFSFRALHRASQSLRKMTDAGTTTKEHSPGPSNPTGEAAASQSAPPAPTSDNNTASSSSRPHGNLIARCNGIFVVRKPKGVTSADVVARVKTVLERQLSNFQSQGRHVPETPSDNEEDEASMARNKGKPGGGKPQRHNKRRNKGGGGFTLKVGHGGTLDPLASGCLVLGVGTGTKELSHFLTCTKEYVGRGRFGAVTDTYDVEGGVVKRVDLPTDPPLGPAVIEQALAKFRGEIVQLPPIYSALKIDGKRLYEYAREGKPLPDGKKIEARKLTVEELELLDYFPAPATSEAAPSEPAQQTEGEAPLTEQPPTIAAKDITGPEFTCRIVSSGGFYVRSFIHDLGEDLGTAAFMTELTRTRQGKLKIEDALEVVGLDLVKVCEAIEKAKATAD